VGKHAAAEGASDDPIVAAALAGRPADTARAHAADGAAESPVGWPAPPVPGGGGLGWPADADPDAEADSGEETDSAAGSEAARAGVAAPELRRGWRRFFGPRRVA
jgi:hypothetical protein